MSTNRNVMDELNSNMQINKAHGKEPNWMVAILTKSGAASSTTSLTSNMNTAKTAGTGAHSLQYYAPISDHQFSLTRSFGNESTSNSIMPDGGLTAHELKIVAPMSSIAANIHNYFSQNIMLATVHLIRLATISQSVSTAAIPFHVAGEYTFNHVYICGIAVNCDDVCLAFRYASLHYSHNSINPLTAAQNGKNVGGYHNLVTGAAAATGKA